MMTAEALRASAVMYWWYGFKFRAASSILAEN